MKRLLFFLMAIVFAIQGWTQTVPITIGTGTTTSNMSALPGYYGYNISANLYLSSEIGVSSGGDIESLEYNISSITAGTSARRLKIYLVEVTDDTLDLNQSWTALTSTATLVYDSTSFYAPTSGWKEFVFTSPFSYSGSGNLLILTEGYGCSASGSCAMTIYNSAGTASICFNRYKDTSPLSFTTNLALLTEGSGNTDKRPNIILNISPLGDYCYPPTQLAVDNITTNSADFTWTTHSTGSSWVVQYKQASDTEWSVEDYAYSGSYSLPNLTPNTLYNVRVKSICTTNESGWNTISFRTACDNIYNLPFENSFDEYGTGSGTFPSCWTKITSNTYPYISTTNSSSPGSMYLYTASGAYNYVVTPPFDSSIPINTLTAFFKLYKTGAAYNITVGVMSDPTDITTFDSITNLTPSATSTWQTFGVNFENYTGTGQHIAFKVQGYGATNSMYIDDLSIDLSPTCQIPTGLVRTIDPASPNSIELDWDSDDDANVSSWIVEYKPLDSDTWEIEYATYHPFILTGLQSNIVYNVRVSAVCVTGETTYPSPTINAGLPCQTISSFPWSEGFEGAWYVAAGLNTGTHPWCWTNINGGASTTDVWRKTTTSSYVRTGSGAMQMYTGSTTSQLGDWMITPTFSLTGNERLRFWAKGYSTYTDVLSIKILDVATNGIVEIESDTSLFVDIMPNTVIPASDWTEYEINLSQFIGDYQIAFVRNTKGGYYLNIDDVSISEIPACARPTDITINYLTDTEAKLTWTPGNIGDAAWYLYYKPEASTDYDSILVHTNTHTLQSLNNNTTYNVYLRTDCGSELSESTSPISITTSSCAAITTLPYEESFDTYGTSTGTFPTCWINKSTTTTYPYISTTNNSAPGSMYFYASSGYNLALTPCFDASLPINTLRANFKLRKTSAAYNISVGVMSNPNDLSTFYEIENLSPTATSVWEDFEVSFAPYQGEGRFVAFKVTYAGSSNYMYLDDLVISEIPACAKPTQLSASDITTTEAEISWVPGNVNDNEWWLYWKESSATDYDSVYVNTNPYLIQNLNPSSGYNVYIATICAGELSEPSLEFSFYTSCDIVSILPYSENFDTYGVVAGSFPQCWERPVLNTTTPFPSINTTNFYSSPASIKFQSASATSPTYVVTPEFSDDINTLRVNFWLKAESTTNSGTMEVGVMSDPSDTSTFELVGTITPTTTNWTQYEFIFSGTTLTGPNNYIAFKHVTNLSNWFYWLDDVVVDYIPSCSKPGSLDAESITTTSADITWVGANPSDSEWWLYFKESSATDYDSVYVTSSPYTLANLSPSSAYNIYMATVCGATLSEATSVFSFRTACGQISTLPWSDSFDDYGTGSTTFPACWTQINTHSSNYPYISTTNYSGPGSLYFYASSTTYNMAVTPEFDASIPVNTLSASFMYRSPNATSRLVVGVMSDPTDATTFDSITTVTSSDFNTWEVIEVNFSSYTGTGQYIAFKNTHSGGFSTSYIDDLVIDITPTCPNTYNLYVASNTNSSITLDWSDMNSAGLGWEVSYAAVGTGFDPDLGTIIPVADDPANPPYTITGLTASTAYSFAVRQACQGNWSNIVTTNTMGLPAQLPYTCDFENETERNSWLLSNGTAANKWAIGSAVNATPITGNSLYVSNDNGVSNAYTLTSISTVVASRLIELDGSGEYTLTFDSKIGGESSYDYLKVYLVDPDTNFVGVSELAYYGVNSYSEGIVLYNGTKAYFNNPNNPTTVNNHVISLPYLGDAGTVKKLVFVWKNDGGGGTQTPAAIDNISITPVLCVSPILSYTNITQTSADATWTAANDNAWWLYSKQTSATSYDSVYVTGTPTHPFSNLTPNTSYSMYVVVDCGTEMSEPSDVVEFRTLCDAITTLPWSENFDALASGEFPNCWYRPVMYSGYPKVSTTASRVHSAPSSLEIHSDVGIPSYAVMPQIDQDINTLRVKFWAKAESTTNSGTLEVGVMSDPNDTTTFESVEIIQPTTTDYIEYEVGFSSTTLTGNNNFIAIRHNTVLNNWYYWIDDVTIDYIPACARPSQLNASNIQAYSADISWNPGNIGDAAWYLYYKTTSATSYDSIQITSPSPYTLSGLSSSTTYSYYLRTDCGTELSEATNVFSFSTPCLPVTTIPWSENFDALTSGEFPACWSRPVIYSTYPKVSTSTTRVHSAPASLEIHSAVGAPTYAITPQFSADINSLKVTFWAMAESTTSSGTLEVGVMSDPSDITTFESVEIIQPTSTAYTQYTVSFETTALTGIDNCIAFRQNTVSAIYYYWIDDVVVDYGNLNPCLPPSNITVTPSNITANMTWTAGGGEASWEVRLGETGTPETVSSTSHSLSGLTPNTTYTVYVRANCGESFSAWIPKQFTTTTDPTPPTVTTAVPSTLITQTTAVFNGEYVETSSPILTKGFEYKEASSNDWIEQDVIDGTTPFTYTATGLTSSTNYQAKAYVNTATDGRVYGNTINFTTLAIIPPTVTTDSVKVLTPTSAKFYGKIVENTEAIEARGFEYKLSTETWEDAINISASGVTTIEATATTLTNGMNYQVRAYARTLSGTEYGQVLTFQTQGLNGVNGQDISIMMYPNPATSQTNLVVSGINGETKIVLSDVQGRILNTINAKPVSGTLEQTIDLNNLAKGVYYIRIQNSDINRTQKLIVK